MMATILPYFDSIVIPLSIAGYEVLALVDPGDTHNFMTPAVASQLGL
jgi:hypothetical protein